MTERVKCMCVLTPERVDQPGLPLPMSALVKTLSQNPSQEIRLHLYELNEISHSYVIEKAEYIRDVLYDGRDSEAQTKRAYRPWMWELKAIWGKTC